MKLISNLSTYLLVIIVKSQEKIKTVIWRFLNFNLKGQILQNVKIQLFYVNFQQYAQFTKGSVLRMHGF